jgi:glycosyltransferase involved in cell wall biosynthesis
VNVLVVNNAVPFIRGGAEELADHLVAKLNAVPGVAAELLRIPFTWIPAERLLDEIVAHRSLRLYNVDRVIALKFPAYLIPHQHKTLWMLHQFRQAYDTYSSGLSHLCGHPNGDELRQLVRNADNACFSECRRIFVNSSVTQERLRTYNGFDSEVLNPPLNDPQLFAGGDYQRYIFGGGRIGPGKRQHLLIEAMQHVKSDLSLVIAGPAESDDAAAELVNLVRSLRLEGRVQLHFGFHSRDKIAAWVNDALACAYLPIDEDSAGYVTMEAFSAAKPVITVEDSGGVLTLVDHETTGFVAPPDPRSIAESFEQLAADLARAQRLGKAARAKLQALNLSWEHTVERLLQ